MSEKASDEADDLVLLEVDAADVSRVVVVSESGEEGSHLLVIGGNGDSASLGDDGVESLLSAEALEEEEVIEGEVDVHDASEGHLGGEVSVDSCVADENLQVGNDTTLAGITELNSVLS